MNFLRLFDLPSEVLLGDYTPPRLTPIQAARQDASRQRARARQGRHAWPHWSGKTYPPLKDTRQQRRHRARLAAKKNRSAT